MKQKLFALALGLALSASVAVFGASSGGSVGGPQYVQGFTGMTPITTTPSGSGTGNINVQKVNGNTVDTGTGAAGTGTQRVAVSSDSTVGQSGTWTVQPGNTANTTPWLFTINQGGNAATVTAGNALKVDGSAVTQPENQAQVNGFAINTGTGTAGTGTQRVAVSSDSAISVNTNSLAGADAKSNTVTNIGNVFDYPSVLNGSGTWDRLHGDTLGLWVEGSVASGTAVSANPLLAGGRASQAAPSAVGADGQAVASWLTRKGETVIAGSSSSANISDGLSMTAARIIWSADSGIVTIPSIPVIINNAGTADKTRAISGANTNGNGTLAVHTAPTSVAGAGIAPAASASAESNHVFKASAGNLYWLTLTTGASSGFLMIFNATSAPGDGAVTPAYCIQVAAQSSTPLSWLTVPMVFSTGITAVFSTTGCFTKTASATAYFSAGSL